MAATQFYATGRRKEATARVFLRPGSGTITVNRRAFDNYFPTEALRVQVQVPLVLTEVTGQFDVLATVSGGGVAGQAGALRHALARALEKLDPGHRPAIKKAGLLTRDSRQVERKKYGQRGARARFQFSKR